MHRQYIHVPQYHKMNIIYIFKIIIIVLYHAAPRIFDASFSKRCFSGARLALADTFFLFALMIFCLYYSNISTLFFDSHLQRLRNICSRHKSMFSISPTHIIAPFGSQTAGDRIPDTQPAQVPRQFLALDSQQQPSYLDANGGSSLDILPQNTYGHRPGNIHSCLPLMCHRSEDHQSSIPRYPVLPMTPWGLLANGYHASSKQVHDSCMSAISLMQAAYHRRVKNPVCRYIGSSPGFPCTFPDCSNSTQIDSRQ